jgi:LemA protein
VDRRRRSYTDVPTTPAAAVFAGRNEVVGRAWAARPLLGHRSRAPVVWWRYRLEEERTHTRTVTSTDSNGNSHTRTETYEQWHEVEDLWDSLPTFEVVDSTGAVPVQLEHAKIDGRELLDRVFEASDDDQGWLARLVDSRTGRYRETEEAVAVGDVLFVVGDAVLDEVAATPVLTGDVLVSTRSEAARTSGLGAGAVALAVLGLGAVGVGVALVAARGPTPGPRSIALGVAGPLLGLVVAWAVVTYNRLRLLGQSIDRAWSLIGVQLQRRHDLVPALATTVAAHAAHERKVLEALAHRPMVRDARDAAGVSREAVAQTSALREVLAVAESRPELTADESFLRLQRELADTETRIAGSRTFYNDALTLLRDRSQAVPAVLVARLLHLHPRQPIPAEGFERTVPAIERTFD